MSKYAELFNQGIKAYENFESRPAIPTEENYNTEEAAAFYGWMLARIKDINIIQAQLEKACVADDSEIFHRRVLSLDIQHGLSPWDRLN
jgi:hypothetical protein